MARSLVRLSSLLLIIFSISGFSVVAFLAVSILVLVSTGMAGDVGVVRFVASVFVEVVRVAGVPKFADITDVLGVEGEVTAAAAAAGVATVGRFVSCAFGLNVKEGGFVFGSGSVGLGSNLNFGSGSCLSTGSFCDLDVDSGELG